VVTDDICPENQYLCSAIPAPSSEPTPGSLDGQVVWNVTGPLHPGGVLTFSFNAKFPDTFDCSTTPSCVDRASVSACCGNAEATASTSLEIPCSKKLC